MKSIITAFLILLLASLALPVSFQFMRDKNLYSGLYFKKAWIGDSRAMLFALPTIYSFALDEKLAFDAVTTPALAFSEMDNSTVFRIAGTKARVSYVFKELLIGTFGMKIPIGWNQFSNNQLNTLGNAGTRQLGFKHSNLFNTIDISAGLSSCIAFQDVGPGNLSIGLGLSYLLKGPFTPVVDQDQSFNPGDEFNISLATGYDFILLERRFNTLADIGFTIYGNDQPETGSEVEVGNKFNWALYAATEVMENVPASIRLANYRKGANQIERIGETSKKASDLILTLTGGIPFLLNYNPYGKVSFGFYSGGGALNFGDAFVFTLGGGGNYQLSEHMFVNGEAGLDIGGIESNFLFGIEILGNLQYTF